MTLRQLLNAYATPNREILPGFILDMDLGMNVYNGKHEEVMNFFVEYIEKLLLEKGPVTVGG